MKAHSQRRLRQIHTWLGLFFAPSIIFFALSGSLQALGFQDRDATYQPPAWVTAVANVHKHGFVRRPDTHAPVKTAKPDKAATPARQKRDAPNPFSVFAALLGILLASATILGVWIALLDRRKRHTAMLMLAAGCSAPLLLLFA